MRRSIQALLIASTLAASWLAMQFVHECGHVLHAWTSGGTVVHVLLHPLHLSRTDVYPNPHPHWVAWGGPVWGSVIPLALWIAAVAARFRHAYLFRFFAGFCLIANGSYIGVGWINGAGDAGDLLRFGTPIWAMVTFGLAAVAGGLWCWNGLGAYFGIGPGKQPVNPRPALAMIGLVALIVVVELLLTTNGTA